MVTALSRISQPRCSSIQLVKINQKGIPLELPKTMLPRWMVGYEENIKMGAGPTANKQDGEGQPIAECCKVNYKVQGKTSQLNFDMDG